MKPRNGITPLSDLDTGQVQNVFVYVCDALRWDFQPKRLTEMGQAIRTAAHGLYTPPGIASLATGIYPPRHGAVRFESSLSENLDTVFDIQGINSSFRHNQWEGHPVFGLLGQSVGTPIDEIEPPFVYVEHDHGAHAPYPNIDLNVNETFKRLSNRPDALREQYREAVDASVDRFFDRLSRLDDRDLRADTLVIFTSDHGELLGEHGGFVGHSLPAAPELIYIPTVFIHPSLVPATLEDVLIEQVDLLPTVRNVLGVDPPSGTTYDGRPLTEPVPSDRHAYNHSVSHFPGNRRVNQLLNPVYEAQSVWTRHGGHVFLETNLLKRFLTGTYDATLSSETGSFNTGTSPYKRLKRLMPMHMRARQTFGTPSIDRRSALTFCNEITEHRRAARTDLSQETIRQLEDLGYR